VEGLGPGTRIERGELVTFKQGVEQIETMRVQRGQPGPQMSASFGTGLLEEFAEQLAVSDVYQRVETMMTRGFGPLLPLGEMSDHIGIMKTDRQRLFPAVGAGVGRATHRTWTAGLGLEAPVAAVPWFRIKGVLPARRNAGRAGALFGRDLAGGGKTLEQGVLGRSGQWPAIIGLASEPGPNNRIERAFGATHHTGFLLLKRFLG
jgi:hypothetical protein